MRKVIVAPSVLSCDKSNFRGEVEKVVEAGAKFIHLDIMDGKFVQNSTSLIEYLPLIEDLRVFRDTHIMVEDIRSYVDLYVPYSDCLTFHLEASSDVKGDIAYIRSKGVKVGISLKPATPVEAAFPYLGDIDLVLVMSVEPGKGGQGYIPSSTGKIGALREAIDAGGYSCLLSVDGGINGLTGPLARSSGADVLVAGSYIYGHPDFRERIKALLGD